MWAAILCADWSKNPRKREVYAAWPAEGRVGRVAPPSGGWTVSSLLREAGDICASDRSAVLVGFDAPLGVPVSYWSALGRTGDWRPDKVPTRSAPANFAEWLRLLDGADSFFEPARDAPEWKLTRPFFIVPPGENSRTRFEARLKDQGVVPLRRVDKEAQANPLFIAAGIPGAVGSSAIDLWQGLAHERVLRAGLAVWPFDGGLQDLVGTPKLVIAEIYPRLAYALALDRGTADNRSPLGVGKTNLLVRASFLEQLHEPDRWPRVLGVKLEDVAPALESEDAFDAFVTATGLLRCVLEETGLSDAEFEDPIAEGGILGSGSVRLRSRHSTFRVPEKQARQGAPPLTRLATVIEPFPSPSPNAKAGSEPPHRCPIPGCSKVFRTKRFGWDAHVERLRGHPEWHPEIEDRAQRKALFKVEFKGFFRG